MLEKQTKTNTYPEILIQQKIYADIQIFYYLVLDEIFMKKTEY